MPLSVNVFVTLARQQHLEYHCKTQFETPCVLRGQAMMCVCVCVFIYIKGEVEETSLSLITVVVIVSPYVVFGK
jgi:hypothetical protein